MKYEYQDVLIKELLNQKGTEVDKSTLTTAEIHVENIINCNVDLLDIKIRVIRGCIENVFDCQKNEYALDFTVYDFDFPEGIKTICFLNFNEATDVD